MQKTPEETNILLVDDEPDFRKALEFSFKRAGYKTFLAGSGNEAFDFICANKNIDVVVSDIRMANGDGVQLLERLRERFSETPVVLLITGFSELTTEEAYEKGAEALFAKPIDQDGLKETIKRLLTPPEMRWGERTDLSATQLKVSIQFGGPSGVDGQIVSIGRGGMFVGIDHPPYPNVNEKVSFQFELADHQSIEGDGVVKWARTGATTHLPAGCGIEFSYLPEEQRKQVMQYIEANRPKAFIPIK